MSDKTVTQEEVGKYFSWPDERPLIVHCPICGAKLKEQWTKPPQKISSPSGLVTVRVWECGLTIQTDDALDNSKTWASEQCPYSTTALLKMRW